MHLRWQWRGGHSAKKLNDLFHVRSCFVYFRYQGLHSPYYKDSHKRFRAAIRDFVQREIEPFCEDWDEAKSIPREIWKKAYAAGVCLSTCSCSLCYRSPCSSRMCVTGWLPGIIGPPWPTAYIGCVRIEIAY